MTATDTVDAAVLRLRPDATDRLEALLVGAGPHLVEVVDVGSAGNGDLLVTLGASAVRLPDLLVAPGGLTAGESVTVLVPLAGALGRLHDAGVALGGIAPEAVVLDPDGRPVWWVPEAPTLRRRVGALAFAARVDADLVAFRALCSAVLGPLGAAVPHGAAPEVLAASLWGVAAAEPVRLARTSAPGPVGPPARLVPALSTAPPTDVIGPGARRLVGSLLEAARAVRVRVWVAFGAVAALLIGALVLLPSGDDGRPASAMPAPETTAPPRPARAAVADRALDGPAAVAALLAERDRCLDRGSEACLRTVDAAGSPVLQADLDAVRAGTDGVRIDRKRLETAPGGGATALATAGEATVLAVRDTNGWRLRDVVAEPPAGG